MRKSIAISLTFLVSCTTTGQESERGPSAPLKPETTYEVFPATVQFGDTPKGTLRNVGNDPLEYERDFYLEMFLNNRWIAIEEPRGSVGPQPDDPCPSPEHSLVLHPGATISQKIEACDQYGFTPALAPGEYRVTKTVLTLPASERMNEVATFEVAAPVGDIPGPSECKVLCISDTRIQGGDTVQVTLDPPPRYGWGVGSELHLGTARTRTPIVALYGWDRDKKLRTIWTGKHAAFEDIGLGGPASWKWVVPKRLEPGFYSIVKDGIGPGSPRIPLKKRIRFWTVSFEVAR